MKTKYKPSVNFQIIRMFSEEGKVTYYQKEVSVIDYTGDAESYKCESPHLPNSWFASRLGDKIIKMANEGMTVVQINRKVNHLLYGDKKK